MILKNILPALLVVVSLNAQSSNEKTWSQVAQNVATYMTDRVEDIGLTAAFIVSSGVLGWGCSAAYVYATKGLRHNQAFPVALVVGLVGLTTVIKAINNKMTVASLEAKIARLESIKAS